MQQNQLAKIDNGFVGMLEQASLLVESGLLPSSVRTPQAAVAIMQMGRELGIAPMSAFSSIFVIDGKPTLSGNIIASLLRKGGIKYQTIRDGEQVKTQEGKVVDMITTIRFYRDGLEEDVTFTFQDAIKAGLVNKDNWKKYPKNMMWWRTLAMGGRRVAPDLLMGHYSTDEMADAKGISIDMDPESGEVITLQTN